MVGFSRGTKILIGALFAGLIALGIAVCFLDLRGLILVVACGLLWWRMMSLKVVFTSTEMRIVNLFSRRAISKESAMRIENGSHVIYTSGGQERRALLTLAMGNSRPEDHTPDGLVKREIVANFETWKHEH